jgi:hypothetical protein
MTGWRTLAGRLRDEEGVALVLAIVMMGMFSIVVTSVMYFSTSGFGASTDSSAGETAYALASAGIADGESVISVALSDTTKVKPIPASAGDTNSTNVTYATGTTTWGGSYDSTNRIWTLKAFGDVKNPNGPNYPDIIRTVTATIQMNGNPPPYSFASLNTGCSAHSLLINASGQLHVTNAMYINSCNTPQDAFDIFGSGGTLTAPAINVVGGWETHNGDLVAVNGVTCALSSASPSTTGPGCPVTGAPVMTNPFGAVLSAPTLGSPACTGLSYGAAVSYAPKQKLTAAINTIGQTNVTTNGTLIQNGDIVMVQTEEMLVTAGGGTSNLTVQRAYNGTTAATHTTNTELKKIPVTTIGSAASPAKCAITSSSGNITLNPGTYYGGICIGTASGTDCTASNCPTSTSTTVAAYAPNQTLHGPPSITAFTNPIPVAGNANPIAVGDTIQIDSEQMTVLSKAANGPNTNVTVTRGVNGTTAALHANNAVIDKVTSNTVANVTMNPGTYIMAGGGFFVCGASTLSAPNVMIYDTQDPSNTAGAGALDAVQLDTTGSVTLGPQTSGPYRGLTIFEDPALSLAPNANCPAAAAAANGWDIGLASMGSTGANGALGSVSGTIYAAGSCATFGDAVSGTANLAVLTSSINIAGGDSTFNFLPGGLFGVGLGTVNQWAG